MAPLSASASDGLDILNRSLMNCSSICASCKPLMPSLSNVGTRDDKLI